jgi:hypothetical protein
MTPIFLVPWLSWNVKIGSRKKLGKARKLGRPGSR